MKLGPVTKVDMRSTAKFGDEVMSANCHVIVFFPTYGQFSAIPKPDSGRMTYKTYVSINNKITIFAKKNADFC